MSYYFSATLHTGFDEAVEQVKEALKSEGFGVLTQIDIQQTLKAKIGADMKKYLILGACNPQFAHKAIEAEPKVGVFLPCNVLVQENDEGTVEVSAVDPIASMQAINNPQLGHLAAEVQQKIKRVIALLS
ncbi:DUF302 domain-containing protein [bacterium]|nr:DUF302 domain-containing protein [bacterium]